MLGLPFQDHRAHHASWSARGGADYQALNCLLHRGIAMLLGRDQEYGGYTVNLYVDDYHYSPAVFAERACWSMWTPYHLSRCPWNLSPMWCQALPGSRQKRCYA